jgi:hypothetical protein
MRLRSGGAYAATTAADRHHEAALPHDVLVRILSFLPPGALAVTPGRVCRAWAAAKKEALAARLAAVAALEAQANTKTKRKTYENAEEQQLFLPLWYVRGECGAASDAAKKAMLLGACFHGLADVVLHLLPSAERTHRYCTRACELAASGGHLDVLVSLRQHGFAWGKGMCCEAAGRPRAYSAACARAWRPVG